MGYGVFQAYVKEHPDIQRVCKDRKATVRHRMMLLAALGTLGPNDLVPMGLAGARSRGDGKQRYVRDMVRKKVPGVYGIHLKKAPIVREQLFEWFATLRHSVKVLTRIPPKVVELKAKRLIHEYVVETLMAGGIPKPPVVTGRWLKEWRMEYRVSFRRPNRKYKVPQRVVEERLVIFWGNMARIRALAKQVLGYDLACFNLDQTI